MTRHRQQSYCYHDFNKNTINISLTFIQLISTYNALRIYKQEIHTVMFFTNKQLENARLVGKKR